jgi:biotin synthase
VFGDAVEVFGQSVVGSHFMVGMGETEKEMVHAFQKVVDLGGINHLFSFFPEEGSTLAEMQPPPLDVYRRIQIACELIDSKKSRAEKFEFDKNGIVTSFGISNEELDAIIDSGIPFMTRGCLGNNGEVACNRPFANSLPGDGIRNFPFPPNEDDIRNIRKQLKNNQ